MQGKVVPVLVIVCLSCSWIWTLVREVDSCSSFISSRFFNIASSFISRSPNTDSIFQCFVSCSWFFIRSVFSSCAWFSIPYHPPFSTSFPQCSLLLSFSLSCIFLLNNLLDSISFFLYRGVWFLLSERIYCTVMPGSQLSERTDFATTSKFIVGIRESVNIYI